MLRIAAVEADAAYCQYLQSETIEEAYWEGRGAELLELEYQRVRAREFNQLLQRIDPSTGEELKPRYGQTITLYSAIVHPPKSVSVLSMIDERTVAAHRLATGQLMEAMERQSAVYSNGEIRPSGNLIMAAFEHRQSRAPDIHLHTHVAIINMSYDAASGSWRALRAEPIFYNRRELTESYRTTLATRLTHYGYAIADKSRDGFEIEGVPKETINRYSRRSVEIKEKLCEENPRMTFSNVGKWTGRDHHKELLPPDQFRQSQLARLTPSERQSLHQLAERAYEQSYKMRPRMEIAQGEEHGPNHRQLTYGERIGF